MSGDVPEPAFKAVSPIDGRHLDGDFVDASSTEIDNVVDHATQAAAAYGRLGKDQVARFLQAAATAIEALGEALIDRVHLETGLPRARLIGERGRTANQLRLFAEVVREGSWVDARIDTAIPDRQPVPKPDVRHVHRPLGPVVVFGASNFPLAFSTAGGDTASALAAGCPVVVKGHPAHPGTAALVAKAIRQAADSTGVPDGVFSLVQGRSFEVGRRLVTHPKIKAVGFTGSFRGGKAVFEYAQSRDEPIPVFAEMGSTNPVFVLPQAAATRAREIAKGLATSVSLGVGQFCTNPGLVFVQRSSSTHLLDDLRENVLVTPPGTMLTAGIKEAYDQGTRRLASTPGVINMATGQPEQGPNQAATVVFKTGLDSFLRHEELAGEVFGPSSMVVECEDKDEMLEAAQTLRGHLTASVHATPDDAQNYRDLLDVLESRVGRLILNGYPTGVEVCPSMVHGGPYPATTVPQSTSVGTNAIRRFVRPVCYQGFSDRLLPDALKNSNPLGIWRLINGRFTRAAVGAEPSG